MNIKFIIGGRSAEYTVCIIQSSILSRLVDEIQYPGNLFRIKRDCFIGIGKVEEMMKSGRKGLWNFYLLEAFSRLGLDR